MVWGPKKTGWFGTLVSPERETKWQDKTFYQQGLGPLPVCQHCFAPEQLYRTEYLQRLDDSRAWPVGMADRSCSLQPWTMTMWHKWKCLWNSSSQVTRMLNDRLQAAVCEQDKHIRKSQDEMRTEIIIIFYYGFGDKRLAECRLNS